MAALFAEYLRNFIHKGLKKLYAKDELERAHQRLGDLFARSEVRGRSLSYLEGLLSGCEQKNSWQVAEWAGEASPYGMQYLLDRSRWDADAVQAHLSEYVQEELDDPNADAGTSLPGWCALRLGSRR